jgi:hypothetical protein
MSANHLAKSQQHSGRCTERELVDHHSDGKTWAASSQQWLLQNNKSGLMAAFIVFNLSIKNSRNIKITATPVAIRIRLVAFQA